VLLPFKRKQKEETETIPLTFSIEAKNEGDVQEIIELPIRRSIIKLNGRYLYVLGSNQKPILRHELNLASIAKGKIAEFFLSDNNEAEIFSPTTFEKAREIAFSYLKQNIAEERAYYIAYIAAIDTVGYGAIGLLLEDKNNIEEIEINTPTSPINVYTAKYGRCETNLAYKSELEFRRSINKLLYLAEKEVNVNNPVVDAELENIRVHAQVRPYAHAGAFASIRIGGKKQLGINKLIANGTTNPEVLAYLWLALDAKLNVIISGAPASGKTTLLASLLTLIPRYNKVIVVEEEANELGEFAANYVSIYSTKKGINLQQQVINTLRMRPDRLIIGEIRGEEAREMFSGSNLGIPFMTTMHSNDGGLSILKKLLIKPMGVEPSALGMLDLAIYMKQIGLSKRIVESIYEYRWLSRGEINDGGIDVGNVDRVGINEIVKNGLLDYEMIKKSKVLDSFAEMRGLSSKKVLEELRKRAKLLENIHTLKQNELSEMVDHYGIGIE